MALPTVLDPTKDYEQRGVIMHMYDCPKFDHCSAPICPLDPDWQLGSHLNGERVCYYLTEYSKIAGRAILRGGLPEDLYEAIADQHPRIIAAHPAIKWQLSRSSKNNPRLRNSTDTAA
jgi:hypothetical protein